VVSLSNHMAPLVGDANCQRITVRLS